MIKFDTIPDNILLHALYVSLLITSAFVLLQQGMLFGWLRIIGAEIFDWIFANNRKWSKYIQKPLWGCLACMSSLWTIILTHSIDIYLILLVCAINAIIGAVLNYD